MTCDHEKLTTPFCPQCGWTDSQKAIDLVSPIKSVQWKTMAQSAVVPKGEKWASVVFYSLGAFVSGKRDHNRNNLVDGGGFDTPDLFLDCWCYLDEMRSILPTNLPEKFSKQWNLLRGIVPRDAISAVQERDARGEQ